MDDLTPEQLEEWGCAYHEAGHAVLQHKFRFKLVSVSIREANSTAGYSMAEGAANQEIHHEGTREQDTNICHHIMSTQAGEVAQIEFCRESFEPHQMMLDKESIEAWMKRFYFFGTPPKKRQERVDELKEYTKQLIRTPICSAAIRALAAALVERKQLNGDQARKLIRETEARTTAKNEGHESSNWDCPHCASYPNEYE